MTRAPQRRRLPRSALVTVTETLPSVDHLDWTVEAIPCAVTTWGWQCEEEAAWRIDVTCDTCDRRAVLVCTSCLTEVDRSISAPDRCVGCTSPHCDGWGEIVELVRATAL